MKRILLLLLLTAAWLGASAQKPDFVVSQTDPGAYRTINDAIQAAPANATKPFIIFVKNGIYREKVVVDRPFITLVGEDRDSTRIIFPELNSKRTIREFNGKPVGAGSVTLTEEADDFIITRMTVWNNYGSTVEPTTAHQMAIYGRADRTIIVNCNVWADGNDDVSLWPPEGNGMFYHADCDFRCPGVDFVCPRGWCYVTRCTFYGGGGRALIWHDGRGDYDKKLVITDSRFDSDGPGILGRYHHDSQFFLINCTMSDVMIDRPITYAYSDQVLDPCPWGNRVYMYNVHRDGGDYKWLADNLQEAKGSPEAGDINAVWTFGGRWDPEKTIQSLWGLIAYQQMQPNGK